MVKRLVDTDDDVLDAARAVLGTEAINATVNESLRRIGEVRRSDVEAAVEELARLDLHDRADAWR